MFLSLMHRHLSACPNITARLAVYDFGDGAAPAIFTTPVFPEDAAFPGLIIRREGGSDFSTRGIRGQRVEGNVQVHTDRLFDGHTVEELANLVWKRLHMAAPVGQVAEGWRVSAIMASPPQWHPDELGYPGYMVRCDLFCSVV